ncbi:MAG TPA: putative cytokinetic ring protein SteA [Coriobacteriia bacterium]|nr:putative cytokinetic ring protein SteA [Coriobacteriia bacterium]
MRHQGIAKLDKRTKDLVKRLNADDVAIIDHIDMDRVSAESLLTTGVEVVINAAPSISGTYPNVGPLLLTRGGVTLIDDAGPGVFECVKEGDVVEVVGDEVLVNGQVCARGTRLSVIEVEERMEAAKAGLGEQLDKFARNTIEYLERERDLLVDEMWVPEVPVEIHGRHVLVVVRGYDFREDLRALTPYIREMRPVLVGVDGGADAIMEAGFKPDVIVGDMDSVTDEALRSGAFLIVHAYADGRAPGMERIEALGLAEKARTWPLAATSEDLALLLAWESGADLIVALGTHANLVEYLDKGRKGMASSFLVRLKVGPKLVDAKGVNKLYRATIGASHLVLIAAAALAVVTAVLFISPAARAFVELVVLRVRALLGF